MDPELEALRLKRLAQLQQQGQGQANNEGSASEERQKR
jgi:DNA-binding TFAR19-related protein (PDSD5 family)